MYPFGWTTIISKDVPRPTVFHPAKQMYAFDGTTINIIAVLKPHKQEGQNPTGRWGSLNAQRYRFGDMFGSHLYSITGFGEVKGPFGPRTRFVRPQPVRTHLPHRQPT